MEAKEFVKSKFPDAEVRAISNGLYELIGVPGLISQAVSEQLAWSGAAKELADPVLEKVRIQAVLQNSEDEK